MSCTMRALISGLILGAASLPVTDVAIAYPIAGVHPDRRPEGAPVIQWIRHDRAWYEHALTGIHPPYPKSLYFLDNQGAWYTPFIHPGMTGRYDIRGWHRQ